nr:zinc knuckle CX2CX4HX4C [Tanacetum cinerariifolium]
MDVWSAPHGVPGSYICVTTHWIEPVTWKMMKLVIAFEDFSAPHSGSALAKTLRNVFVNFNLKNKIMSITLDNASNNTSTIGKLKLKYDPPMEGRFYHSRCVAHIIKLCVQDGLAVPMINNIKESFKTTLKDLFIWGGKNHQRYVRICKQAGKPCLSWDVPTRWNSTYHMFLSGLKQKSTLIYFHDLLASKASEFAFSTSGKVLSIRRTRLTPAFLEMCMCLKDHLDAQERKQDKFTLETPVDFEEEILDAEVRGEMIDGEESLRGIATRMNKMTGKSGSGTSQTHTATRVLVNPNSGHDVLQGNAPHTFTSNISQEHAAHDNANSHGFDEIVYSVSDISDFNPSSIRVVSDFFKVSLLTPIDIDKFVRDLDSDKIKVWSMLTKEQRDGVIDIVGVQLESLLSDNNDITSEKPSDPIVQSVDINPTLTSYAGAVGASTIEDGINLIASFIGKRVMFDSCTSSMCSDSWGRSSFARCLIEVNSEANLVDVVPIGIPSLTGEDFTKKTIQVEYEWRPPKCDVCKIFGHVHDQCPNKVVSHSIVTIFTIVTPTVELLNYGFQTVGKKKKKGKPKSTNSSQFVGSSVKHNVRYEPKATTNQPKKVATAVCNASKLSSKSKSSGTSSKEGNVTTSNSYSALENDEYEDEEHVENLYDESANLF